MNTLTFTTQQATLLVTVAFLAGVGAAYICHAIIRAALTAPFAEPEPDVIVVEAPRRRRAPVLPARQRFTTKVGTSAASSNKPVPSLVVSPAQWARQAFDDPSRVRLAVQIGAAR